MRHTLSTLLVGLLLATAAQAADFPWPHEDADSWRLCFVDVETTGLVPGHHEMIDAGMVWTDLEGRELADLFVRIQPEHPERASDGAVAVNSFSAARWDSLGALSAAEATERMVAINDSVRAGGKRVLMVALNSHFDTAFLDHLFRSVDSSWRDLYFYFVLDIPSMAWSLGHRQLTGAGLSELLGVEDEPHVAELHTGITGAKLNARLYRALLADARARLDGPE